MKLAVHKDLFDAKLPSLEPRANCILFRGFDAKNAPKVDKANRALKIGRRQKIGPPQEAAHGTD
jgi:hypothetical protein